MSFNLENYETVKSRKKRFYHDHPDGSIIVRLVNLDVLDHALFEAKVYRTKEEQEKNLPTATGYALELRETELSATRDGKKYESVNYSSWCENSEESAIGRALDNAGYSGNDKCSREEMEKVQKEEERKKVLIEKMNALSDDVKEGFKILGYSTKVVVAFCERFGWEDAKILNEIKKIVSANERAKE